MSNEKYWIRHENKQVAIRQIVKQIEIMKKSFDVMTFNKSYQRALSIYRNFLLNSYREK